VHTEQTYHTTLQAIYCLHLKSLSSNCTCPHLIVVVRLLSLSSTMSTLTLSSSLPSSSLPSCSTSPHHCCHSRHPCCWHHCCCCCRRHQHHHHRSSSSCLSCPFAVNPRNLTKASQCGIAHGMGIECLWIHVTMRGPQYGNRD